MKGLVVRIIGVDCSTLAKKTGICVARVEASRCVVEVANVCKDVAPADFIAAQIQSGEQFLIAIDAPLGWPQAMGDLLSWHQAGQVLDIDSNMLFRRHTDRFIKDKLGKQSLDVGADRIARTAHAALQLLEQVRSTTGMDIPLAWSGGDLNGVEAIEVYPAATLISHGIDSRGYKEKNAVDARGKLLSKLMNLVDFECVIDPVVDCDDVLDAVVCGIAGFDFLSGAAFIPEDVVLAKREGWIWARDPSHRM